MDMFNEPVFVEVDLKLDNGRKYFGRFKVKPHLTLAERADAVRNGDTLSRGIDSIDQRQFLRLVAFVNAHIVETDAAWWKGNGKTPNGLGIVDEEPIYEILKKINELQRPEKSGDSGSGSPSEGAPTA